jgi:protein-disulfide isomerase
MSTLPRSRTAAVTIALAAATAAGSLAAAAQAPSTSASPPKEAATSAPRPPEVKDAALTAWLEGFFTWGPGEVKIEEVPQVRLPGARLLRVMKSYAGDARANDQLFAVLEEGSQVVLIGDAFGDEEKLKHPAPVRTEADLAGLRESLKKYFQANFRMTLDPSLDRKGWKGVVIRPDTGYGSYPMTAYVSAQDGAVFLIGRPWDRNRSAAEQRREMIKLNDTPSAGPADAKITVVEFSDMECGFCKKRTLDWEALLAKMGRELKIRRYVKSFPLTVAHPWAFRAASAARCFFERNPELYFRFKSNIYAKQDQLNVAAVDAFALDFAAANEVPEAVFKACYLQAKSNEKVLADLAEGFAVRVRATPTYFIDGVAVSWFSDSLMEEYLRKTYLGGKGLPLPAPPPTKK